MERRIVPFSLISLLGFALIGLAIPRTVAAWKAAEGRPALDRLEVNETPTAAQLATCIGAYTYALRWEQTSNRLFDLGSCEFATALAKPSDQERGEWLKRAEESTVRGLLLNPAESFAWSRLAFIRQNRHVAARDVVTPLMMSLDTGPNMRDLWRGRSRLVLRYAPYMTPEELLTARFQLRTIWDYAPSERPQLLEAAHNLDRLSIVLWALRDDPEAMAELETMERNTRFP